MNEAKIQLRLPRDIRDWFADEARRADRSMNGQMVAILRERMVASAAKTKNAPSAATGGALVTQ